MIDLHQVGQARRVVYLGHATLLVVNEVGDVGDGRDDVHIELTVETLLNDLHVEQTKESTAEAEA